MLHDEDRNRKYEAAITKVGFPSHSRPLVCSGCGECHGNEAVGERGNSVRRAFRGTRKQIPVTAAGFLAACVCSSLVRAQSAFPADDDRNKATEDSIQVTWCSCAG